MHAESHRPYGQSQGTVRQSACAGELLTERLQRLIGGQ
jgi:hypothetical protein